jgi:hypothetical protein
VELAVLPERGDVPHVERLKANRHDGAALSRAHYALPVSVRRVVVVEPEREPDPPKLHAEADIEGVAASLVPDVGMSFPSGTRARERQG